MVAPVIKLQAVSKVFLTDEVETDALSDGESVVDLLQELHRAGATICMVTHDPRYARHAERHIHLFDGRVVAQPLEMAAS
jgi:putative ABC transport system ATP-binding protein